MKEIDTVRYDSEVEFIAHINGMLGDGWEILSSSCGFANSEYDNFPSIFHAILIRDIPEEI